MNIIVAITVVLKCAPECIKMQHFEGENTNFFRRRGIPLPRPHPRPRFRRLHSSAFGIRVQLFDHISGYGPGLSYTLDSDSVLYDVEVNAPY